ncbi:MAG: hypothetical protein R2729_31205 [Bryobacteraceae bacterium]
MRRIGFSTGALARGDFRTALEVLRARRVEAVELSALRMEELEPLLSALPTLDLSDFSFVSIHAPSRFTPRQETLVVQSLLSVKERGYPVVVHPDVIFVPEKWTALGESLFVENMDKRKPVGRTVRELKPFFHALPEARFCFDVGHARQVDPTMTEAVLLLQAFGDRVAEVHMSEVNTASRHDPISLNAVHAFASVMPGIDPAVPIILESLIDAGQSDVEAEMARARDTFAPLPV